MLKKQWMTATLIAALSVPTVLLAQAAPPPAPEQTRPDAGQRGTRGNFDPAQWRERIANGIKDQLGATAEEWQVLQPKIEKVMTAQRETRGGFGMTGGRRGGGGADNTPRTEQPQSAVAKASAELRTALEKKDTPADQIQQKLTALRDARAAARTELEAAQKELKELLTARQEAVLVSMGMLE